MTRLLTIRFPSNRLDGSMDRIEEIMGTRNVSYPVFNMVTGHIAVVATVPEATTHVQLCNMISCLLYSDMAVEYREEP